MSNKKGEPQKLETRPTFSVDFKQQIIPQFPDEEKKEYIDIKYPLIPPYAYAHIFWDDAAKELVYFVEEPVLNKAEENILDILEDGIKELINISYLSVKSGETVIEYLEKNINILIDELQIEVSKESYLKLMYFIYRDFVGLNEIEPMLNDYFIEDIECNGINTPIYIVHRKYRNLRTNIIFKETEKLTSFVEKLSQKCGQYISYATPLLDGALPDGSVDYNEQFIYKENSKVKTAKIGDFVDKFYKEGQSNIPIKVKNLQVPAFDKDMKNKWREVDYVYRHKISEELYNLELEAGRKVKLTGAHSVFILKKDKIKPEVVANIQKGDYIIAPLTLPENNTIKAFNLAQELSKSKYHKKILITSVPTTTFKYREKEIKEYYSKNYKRVTSTYYEHKNKRILPIDLYTLLSQNELRKCNISTTSDIQIPTFLEVNKELMRLLGYYVGEGWIYNVKNHYRISFCFNKNESLYIKEVNDSFVKCFSNKIYKEPEDKNAVKLTINSLLIYLVFKDVLKISKGAKNKEVPELIFNVSKELQQEFIRAWHNSDLGSTTSKKLANDISYLSLFNKRMVPFYQRDKQATIDDRKIISHEIYTNYYRREISDFHTMIPMELFNPLNKLHHRLKNSRIRRNRLKKLLNDIRFNNFNNLKKVKSNKFIEEWTKRGTIKSIDGSNLLTKVGQDAMYEYGFVKKLIDSDFIFLKINKINRVKSSSQYVYDVSVPGCENFVAGTGGVFCHNSRVNATFTEDISSRGPTFTIRKFTKNPWTPTKLMQLGTVSPQMLAYLWILIEYESNIMVIGGTGSGKTTLLNALTFFIPPQSRVVSIEDTRELNLDHENWLPAVSREGVGLVNLVGQKYGEVSLFDLLRESFRQRPDYVIVGEVRGQEAYVLFQGMSSIRGNEEVFIIKGDKPHRIKIKDLKDLKDCKAITYDLEKRKVEILPVRAVLRHPTRKTLYKLTTKTGREITLTPDHSVFKFEDKIISAPMESLKIGDKIIIPSKIPCGYADLECINLMEFLPDARVYAPELIKQAVLKIGYYHASSLVGVESISDYYSNFARSKPSSLKVKKFIGLMEKSDIDYSKEKIKIKFDKKSESMQSKLKITPEFLRLLGYYLSEGSLNIGKRNNRISLYNKNKEILADMEHCIIQVTNKRPRKRQTNGFGEATELSINHKVIYELLKKYCKTKQDKTIPDFIFGLSKEKIGYFLSALYDGDGSFNKNHFGYYTTSIKFADDITKLLLVFGIVAKINKRNRIGRKTTDYEILFYHSQDKSEFLKHITSIKSKIRDINIFKTNSKIIGDLYIDKVKSIEPITLDKKEPVYDIAIQGTRNFIGGFGGILLHNSGHPSFGTMHANSVETLIRRLETPPINLSSSLVEVLDAVCVVIQTKIKGESIRRIREISEIISVKEGLAGAVINNPFVWNPQSDTFLFKSDSYVFKKITLHHGITREELFRELELRAKLLVAMYKKGIFGFKEVRALVNEYYKDPKYTLKKFGVI